MDSDLKNIFSNNNHVDIVDVIVKTIGDPTDPTPKFILKQQVIERLKLNYGLHLDEQPSEQANNVGDEATDQTRYIYGR
ncbi:17458_t:CDS:2 [Rhizophagus irregularis]|nr:17458_t:CDS:2 [Rhizophagus irregularis]